MDCAPLKTSLVSHCESWVKKFTGLLNNIAQAELKSMQDYFEGHKTSLAKQPLNLDMLAESVNLLRRLIEEKPQVEARFEPLREKYKTLEKFEVQVSEREQMLVERLPADWNSFQQILNETEGELEKRKVYALFSHSTGPPSGYILFPLT